MSGGDSGNANGNLASILGGHSNQAASQSTTAIGGEFNVANGFEASVVAGNANRAGGTDAVVLGGGNNTANGGDASVGGGQFNLAGEDYSSLVGGCDNLAGAGTVPNDNCGGATGTHQAVLGGIQNNAVDMGDTVAGGFSNTASTNCQTIPATNTC